MKVAVVGTGYVGLVTGVCFAELGHNVVCVDVDEKKISQLKKGKPTIYEAGLTDLLQKNIKAKRISFTTNSKQAISSSDVVFSAVGTPMGKNHEADLQYVIEVANTFAESINKYTVLVTKSTVPVGTADMLKEIINSKTSVEFDVVSNPEFLREGNAIKDFMVPDRIVVGTETERARKILEKLYQPIVRAKSPILFTDIKSAELIKYAANSMLATRISFINEIARLCDLVGADVKTVATGIGMDDRIGPRFLQAGVGYGGSCFPKDVQALIYTGKQKGYNFQILNAVEKVNQEQRNLAIEKLRSNLGEINGKKIVIWGLSFKPKTSDVREAPAESIVRRLLAEKGEVFAYDPIANEDFKEHYPDLKIKYMKNKYEKVEGADAIVLLTEWDEFRTLDFDKLKSMRNRLILDGRNIYNPKEIMEHDFQYVGFGHN